LRPERRRSAALHTVGRDPGDFYPLVSELVVGTDRTRRGGHHYVSHAREGKKKNGVMECWVGGFLIVQSLSLPRKILSLISCVDFFQHRGAEGDISDALSGVVFVKGDLFGFGAAFLVA